MNLLTEAGQRDLLEKEEELELGRRIQSGDKEAREKLVISNILLVFSMAQRFKDRGLDIEDLVQEGFKGLIRAVDKFDYTRGYRFTTYASHWIKQSLIRGIHNSSQVIRVPIHAREKYYNMLKDKRVLGDELGREPTEEELYEYTGSDEFKYRNIKNIMEGVVSTSKPLNGSNGENTSILENTLVDEEQDAEKDAINALINPMIQKEMKEILTEREYEVLVHRYGLENQERKTLNKIGELFGNSGEAIRQVQAKAFKKLRKSEVIREVYGR